MPKSFNMNKAFKSILLSIILIVTIVVGYLVYSPLLKFFNGKPVNELVLNDKELKFTDKNTIIKSIEESGNLNKGFFSFDLGLMFDSLKQNSWVDSIIIVKSWPDKISVKVSEKTPYAVWTNGIQTGFISDSGEIFYSPTQTQENLEIKSKLEASKDQLKVNPKLVIQQTDKTKKAPIFITNRFYLNYALAFWEEIREIFAKSNFTVKEIRVDSIDYWRILLDNNIELRLDNHDIKYSIARYIEAAKLIKIPEGLRINYVDLRYEAGFAVSYLTLEEIRKNPNLLKHSLIPGKGGEVLVNANFVEVEPKLVEVDNH